MSHRYPGGIVSAAASSRSLNNASGIWTLTQYLQLKAPGDPYWSYVSYLLNTTATNAAQNNTFLDSSANNFTITRNGNTTQGAFNPYKPVTLPAPGYTTTDYGGSGYFDGGGDYLTAPASSNWIFSGDYTLEAWVYPTASGADMHIFGTGGSGSNDQFGVASGVGTGRIYWAYGAVGNYLTTTATIPANAWTHIAVTRNSNTLKAFVNGAEVFSGTMSTTVGQNATNYIGRRSDGFNSFTGYMAGARIVTGTAVYTTAFTPPTAPVTAVTNTSLLLNFTNAGIFDASMQNDMETVGSAQVSSAQAKFGTTSLYSPNSTSYLNSRFNQSMAFGTGDFTIEAWVYSVATSAAYTCIVSSRDGIVSNANAVFFGLKPTTNQLTFFTSSEIIGTTTAVSTGTWTHVALVRNAVATAIYINGISSGTATFTTTLTGTGLSVGNEYNGASGSGGLYIDDLRITKGYARYTANFTPPTAELPVY